MKRMYLLCMLSLFAVSQAFAGTTGKVAGVIKDAQTGEVLPGANVVVIGTRLGATTDIDGAYFILNVPPGIMEVQASMVGYAKVTQTGVRVKIDQTAKLNFELREEALQGDEILVVAVRPPVEIDLTASKQTMTTEELQLSWANTVEEAVELQSGVGIRNSIRGGFGINAAYMVDGVDMRDNFTQSSFVVTNTSAIQEMEVLSGGYNAEYGQANDAIHQHRDPVRARQMALECQDAHAPARQVPLGPEYLQRGKCRTPSDHQILFRQQRHGGFLERLLARAGH